MHLSSLANRTYLYEDHLHTLINNSDKHGRSSKHEAAEVERCFESMNGSEKMSSEAPSGCSSIEKKAIDSGWSLFFVAAPRVRTRTSLYTRTLGEQNLPFTDGKQIADAFGVKWRSRDDRCLNTYKPAGHRQYQKLLLRIWPQ